VGPLGELNFHSHPITIKQSVYLSFSSLPGVIES